MHMFVCTVCIHANILAYCIFLYIKPARLAPLNTCAKMACLYETRYKYLAKYLPSFLIFTQTVTWLPSLCVLLRLRQQWCKVMWGPKFCATGSILFYTKKSNATTLAQNLYLSIAFMLVNDWTFCVTGYKESNDESYLHIMYETRTQ